MSLIGLFAVLTAAWAQDDVVVAGSEPEEISVRLTSNSTLVVSGYLDIGWFDAQGDGVAYRRVDDLPAGDIAWAFSGDPWANSVNSLGESADLGTDTTTTLERYDAIDSNGNPSFIANQWHQAIAVSVGDRVSVRGAFKLAPRPGNLGSMGDAVWVDTAYVEWLPLAQSDLRITAGKVESSFNREYRYRQSPDRYGITPSLIARYTTGTPVGLKARGSVGQVFWYAASLTNSGTATERFGHFAADVDDDASPTGTARLGIATPGRVRLEAGVSGQAARAANGTPDTTIGADLGIDLGPVEVRAELLRTRYPGHSQDTSLIADGWFVEVSALPVARVRPLLRVDHRNAELITGPNRYDSDVLRATAGLRLDASPQAGLKFEYIHLRELQGPEIPDDVMTTSAVFRY